MTSSMKIDQKNQRNSNLISSGSSTHQSALHQQMGIVGGSTKSSHLSTAQLLTMQGQNGNYNFGTLCPDQIRAIVTLYLVMSLIHTVHSRLKTLFIEQQRKRIKIGQFFVVLCIIALAVLDIVVVNDLIIINNNDSYLSALAVNDVYTSVQGSSKNRNKEFQQYLDYLISSVVLGYRWVSMVFLISSLWTRDLRPFIKGKKAIRSQIETQMNSSVNIVKAQPLKIIEEKTINCEGKQYSNKKNAKQQLKLKNQRLTDQITQPRKNNIILNQQPPVLSNQASQFSAETETATNTHIETSSKLPAPSTEAETKVNSRIVQRRRTRKIRSESQTHNANSTTTSVEQVEYQRSSSEMTRLQKKFDLMEKERDFHLIIHGHLFQFSLSTQKGDFKFETNSISEFNKKIDDISNTNNWHDFIALNVKLYFWREAFQKLKNASSKNIVKGELIKLISQYSLLLINQQQNFGIPMVEFE